MQESVRVAAFDLLLRNNKCQFPSQLKATYPSESVSHVDQSFSLGVPYQLEEEHLRNK